MPGMTIASYTDTATGRETGQVGTGGGPNIIIKGGVLDQGTYPEYVGLPVALTLPSAGTYVIQNVQNYHWGELAILMGLASTLSIAARYADGVTVGILTAIGPAGTRVVLNAAQLLPANNGRYGLDRFDGTDLVITKTGAAADTVIGRLASA